MHLFGHPTPPRLSPASRVQLYLPRGSLEATDITTAKSSEVNVIVPGATGTRRYPLHFSTHPRTPKGRPLLPSSR